MKSFTDSDRTKAPLTDRSALSSPTDPETQKKRLAKFEKLFTPKNVRK